MNKKESNRGFGILFFIVFVIISIWPLFKGGDLRLWSLIIAFIFLVLGLLNSKFLTPAKRIWIRFGELLGKIISPIVLSIIFFLLITPIGILMKILRKDLLNLRFTKDKTYWIKRNKDLGSMNNQF
tara:strand:+ start:528 stop:905 length:378 start_codon:yes stop_codon:yes gene_type:complete